MLFDKQLMCYAGRRWGLGRHGSTTKIHVLLGTMTSQPVYALIFCLATMVVLFSLQQFMARMINKHICTCMMCLPIATQGVLAMPLFSAWWCISCCNVTAFVWAPAAESNN